VFPVLYHTVVNSPTYSNQLPRTTQKHKSVSKFHSITSSW